CDTRQVSYRVWPTQATCPRALRPSRLPISASVDLSGSDRLKRVGRCLRKIRFSAVFVLQQQLLGYQPSYPCFLSFPGHRFALAHDHFNRTQPPYDLLRCKTLFWHFPRSFLSSVSQLD